MPSAADTRDQSWTYRRSGTAAPKEAIPGLLMLFSGAEAALLPIPLGGGTRVLGRGDVGGVPVDDGCMSRRHAEVGFDGARWQVRDLGSRNGTWVDGVPVAGGVATRKGRILRVGDTLFGLLSDLRSYQGAVIEWSHGVVLGPTLREAWTRIAQAARGGDRLHLFGESGTGKELGARHFHREGANARGPFVPVNCATVPPNLAERLLFGARKGAYSGATADVEGFLQSAHEGTLFLDEIAELDAAVQAKLLRALETKEVLALGANRPRKVELSFCSATHRDLRELTGAKKFREDLFFRIGRPAVGLPPLRDRLEDIAWIIQGELGRAGGLRAHVSLVEACLSRPWPGNVRELMAAVQSAAREAGHRGAARVEATHLSPDAGRRMVPADAPAEPPSPAAGSSERAVAEAMRAAGGNVAGAARALGWHRTQLRRWLSKHGSKP